MHEDMDKPKERKEGGEGRGGNGGREGRREIEGSEAREIEKESDGMISFRVAI